MTTIISLDMASHKNPTFENYTTIFQKYNLITENRIFIKELLIHLTYIRFARKFGIYAK